MPPNKPCALRALMLTTLAALLSGCASVSPPPLPPHQVAPPSIPALPPAARQPPTPQVCARSCSAALSIELDSWLNSPTVPPPPAPPASAATTH